MARGEAESDLAVKIEPGHHTRAIEDQIALCSSHAVIEKDRLRARVLRGIAATLQFLLDEPNAKSSVVRLRLHALNSGYPILKSNEVDKVMEVVLGLTSSEAKKLAIATRGKKAWPFA